LSIIFTVAISVCELLSAIPHPCCTVVYCVILAFYIIVNNGQCAMCTRRSHK